MIESASPGRFPGAELSRRLAEQQDPAAVMEQVVLAALDYLPGTDYAGITVVTKDGAQTPAQTAELVSTVDAAQYALDEGPCLTAAREREAVVTVNDLGADGRWPRFAAQAVELGVRAMASFHLPGSDPAAGAINVYAARPDAFGPEAVDFGPLLASHASLAIRAAAKQANLQIALDSRDLIGQAKGILMERHKIDAAQAFERLVRASQQSQRKLRDIAEQLALTGELSTA